MGCVSSKQARSDVSPARSALSASSRSYLKSDISHSGSGHLKSGFGASSREIIINREDEKNSVNKQHEEPNRFSSSSSAAARSGRGHSGNFTTTTTTIAVVLKKEDSENIGTVVFSNNNNNVNVVGRLTEGEHVAAGWPSWLSSVAGDAIDGWLPLRADMFQRLDKIGQGTYSTVYKARDLESGKMVALKKVRFDNFQPESVRFMAREIMILRRLDHPNIMRLKGIITSRLSCSIYLVFEYMEHDLAGLLSCPEIKFNESQIKCYMKQLMSGLEHCHSTGVIHRDIKLSNILVNDDGILKIADFGLANFVTANNNQPLTSRVVTLWYRPPELLLGSTSYGVSVDLWSAGCVFAELFCGRPFLKGRTEVEQLHKIFKLCGSPPEEYWKKSKLPLATVFKPQHPYESTLRERCREFPKAAADLIETLLSIEPYKRGTASSALASEYFHSPPYACDPSSFQKFPPNKEIDAKLRDEERRKKAVYVARGMGASKNPLKFRKVLQESVSFNRAVVPAEEVEASIHFERRNNVSGTNGTKGATVSRISLKPSYDTTSEVSQTTTELSQAETTCSAPPETTATTNNFTRAKIQKQLGTHNAHVNYSSRNHQKLMMNVAVEPPSVALESSDGSHTEARSPDMADKRALRKKRLKAGRLQSFDSSEIYHSRKSSLDNDDQQGRTGLSGPFFQQSNRFDARQDSKTRQAVRRSRFSRDHM